MEERIEDAFAEVDREIKSGVKVRRDYSKNFPSAVK